MSQLIRRSPSAQYLEPQWREKMGIIRTCIECGKCMNKCPYGLNIPKLLRKNLEDYENILKGKATV